MDKIKLSITACVLSLNRPVYLKEALFSIINQTNAPEQIIIFDNGSKKDVFDSLKDCFSKSVSWQGADTTKSVFWNFRRAVASIESKYALIMHDDDRLCSDFISKQVEFLEKHPKVVAVSCNGYLIDENGKRSGRKLLDVSDDSNVEVYKCSVDVAIKYASDSCIPFSPLVYRTEVLKKIDLREEYGKVCDAVFICDIADIGNVAYQPLALYECRVHDGQDSSYFPTDLLLKLEKFFWTRSSENNIDIKKLHKLLISQHTSRNIVELLRTLKSASSLQNQLIMLIKVWDDKFSLWMALRIIINSIKKSLLRVLKSKLGFIHFYKF